MAVSREQLVQAAEKLVARGKVEAAIGEYRKVLDEAPRDTSTLNRIGDLWLRLERVDEARKIFARTAEAFVDDGFLVKAIAIYKKIIKYDPTGLETYEKLADLYHRQGLVNEARSQYEVLADYYMRHGPMSKAMAITRQMVALEPDRPEPHAKLATIHQQLGALDEALAEHRTIAELMLAQGHGEEAGKVLFNGLSVDATDSGYIEWAVKALNQAGQAGAAARFLATAIDRNPAAQEIASRLGLDRGRGGARQLTPPPRPATPFPRQTTPLPRQATPLPKRPVAAPPAAAPAAHSPDATHPALPYRSEPPGRRVAPPPIDTDAIPLVNFDEIELEGEGFEALAPRAVPAAAAPRAPAADAPASGELELDLEEEVLIPWQSMADFDARGRADAETSPSIEIGRQASETPLQLDPEVLESTAAEVEESLERQEDLVAEAEVYSRYGLRARALERLRDALKRNPANLDAYRVLVQMHVEQGRNDRVLEVVRQLQTAVPGFASTEVWRQIRQRLLKLGFQIRGTTVTAPQPGEDESGAHEVKSLINEVLSGAPPASARKRAGKAPAPAVPIAAPPPVAVPTPEPAPDVAPARRLSRDKKNPAEELFDDTAVYFLDLAEDLELQAAQQPAPLSASPRPPVAPLPSPAAAEASAASLFPEGDQFFDLAAELERELAEVEGTAGPPAVTEMKEQSLEEIVQGFKRGVAEVLSKEDFETHYNLGIAYREMGLLDEAIGEFQLSAKSPALILDSCSLLGVCFLDKDLPELAVKWYRRALDLPGLTDEQHLALLYELGNAELRAGERDTARKVFVEIYGIDSNYRDVVARLAELRR